MKSPTETETETATVVVRASRCVFISHSSEDSYFVTLLERLLRLHRHQTWCDLTDLDGGAKFPETIRKAIREADVLIAVLSSRSVASRWITTEIAMFQAAKPDGLVIPVLLEPVDLDEIVPGLRDHNAISFHADMLMGFNRLFVALGDSFLSLEEITDRRDHLNGRRALPDRRRSSISQRLRTGLMLGYTRVTGKDYMQWDPRAENAFDVRKAFESEVRRYEYFDQTGQVVDQQVVLEEAMKLAWQKIDQRDPATKVHVFGEIAEDICGRYEVRTAQRRLGERREQ